MSSQLTRDEVLRIAGLAHLELTDAEVELFGRQLTSILEFADVVRRADTSQITPTSHPLDLQTLWRADEPVAGLDRATILAEAPDADADEGLFLVPKVL